MKEYRIETLKLSPHFGNYLPCQILGDKKILRTTKAMTIAECKEFIKSFNKPKWHWVLIELE